MGAQKRCKYEEYFFWSVSDHWCFWEFVDVTVVYVMFDWEKAERLHMRDADTKKTCVLGGDCHKSHERKILN